MSNGYMIETRDGAVGVAVRDGNGFRFFASRPPFYALDNRTFPRLRAVHSAVEAVAKEARGEAADGSDR
jgi:hypothetical protein